MQYRQPPPLPAGKVNLFTPGGNKKGKVRPAPTSMTEASRAHPAPTMRPQPPPPPPPLPLTAMTASGSGSGSGPPLAPSPQSHRTPPNHHFGPPPPLLAGQARPLSSLATPDIRKQVTTAMKLLATITRDQQDRDYLEKAYDWPDLAEDEREALNANLAQARQAEMAQRDKAIEATYSRLSNDMVALFTGLVEHATSSWLEGLVRRCDAQQKRIDDLEAQRGASSTATTTTTGDTNAAAATVAAAQQKRIEDLERKLNTLLQAQQQVTPSSSSSPRPAAPPGRPQTYSPAASPPGTPFDPTSSAAPADLHATYKELRDKYRHMGNEVVSQKARIEKLHANVAELQKKLVGHSEEAAGTTRGGGEGEVVKGLEKRLEKVDQALVATQQQQQGTGGAVGATTSAGGSTVDPRRRPSSTTLSSAAQTPAAIATAAEFSSQLGKRPHDGVDGDSSSAPDHPHKAPKSTEGATPASLAAPAVAGAEDDDEEQQQQLLKERLQKVEERLEGCEEKVTALRSDVDKGVSRIDATVVNVADLEKKEKERTERSEQTAAPPTSKGGSSSSTSDMDLDKSDEDDKERANTENFDVLERRIQQMEASGSPELLIEPVKNEVAELRKLFDERVPLPNTPEHPKTILVSIRNLEEALAKSSAFTTPVVEALRSFVGTAADGSALAADQVRSRLLDTLVRMRDDLQRHGTTLASHDQSIKSLVKANEETDAKFEALEDLGNLLSEALPQLRDLYIVVCRAQEMNLFPKTATLFPNANANANANAITNGSHQSATPGTSTTTTGAANAAPNGIVNGASGSGSGSGGGGGANPPPQPNGIVGAPPPPTTTTAATNASSTATSGANAPAQGRPSAPPAAPSTSTSTSTSPSSLPQRPQQPQGQQRPRSANGSSSGASRRSPIGPGVGWVLDGPW